MRQSESLEPMSETENTTETGVKSQSSARERARARVKGRATPRAANPTRSIEPGMIHYRVAQGILEGVRDRAAVAGIELDVGEFPDFGGANGDTDDPQRLANIVAHAVARVGDKFSPLRRFSRNMEGQEKRAGLVSDLVAALYTLWKRNPAAAEQLARGVISDVKQRQSQRASEAKSPTTQGVTQ